MKIRHPAVKSDVFKLVSKLEFDSLKKYLGRVAA